MPQGARGLGFLCCGGGTSRLKEGVSSFQEKLEESDAGRMLLCDLSIQAPGGAECPSTVRPSTIRPSARPPSTRPLSPPPWPSPALPQGPGPQPSCAPLLAGPGPLRSPPIRSPLIREQRPRAGSAAAVGRHRTHQLLSGSSPALLSQACVTVTRKCTPPTSHTRTRIHVPHTCIRTTHVRAQTHTDTHTRLYGELRPRATLFLIHRPDQVPAGPRHPAQPGIQGQDPDPCASVGPFWVRVSVRTSLHLLQTFPQSPAVRFPCPGTSFFRSVSFIFEEHFCYKKTVGFIPCAGPPFPRLRWGVQEFPPQGAVL